MAIRTLHAMHIWIGKHFFCLIDMKGPLVNQIPNSCKDYQLFGYIFAYMVGRIVLVFGV